MSEILRSPNQIIEAVSSIRRELDKRNSEHIKTNLEFIRGTFPEIVDDCKRLVSVLLEDGRDDLTVEREDGFESPSIFIGGEDLKNPATSRSASFYQEIDEKYFHFSTEPTQEARSAKGARRKLFDQVFFMTCGHIFDVGQYQESEVKTP